MNIDIGWLSAQFSDLTNLRPLNSGGQKDVFSADHATDGAVVLKIIHPTQSIETVRREILAVRKVRSSRIPKILDDGHLSTQIGPCVWIREARVEGDTLRECIQQRGSLDCRSVLKLGLQILEPIVTAEQVSIVHRDVKPDNIMRDNNGDFWLLDFGLARHLQLSSQTASAAHFGKFTPGYAPPEQFRNLKRQIDARSDLFGLGVTLYECATGSNPFRDGAANVVEVLMRVEQRPLPRLSLGFSSASDFADLVSAMTQRRRDHRPATAKEAFDWIQEICGREGVI